MTDEIKNKIINELEFLQIEILDKIRRKYVDHDNLSGFLSGRVDNIIDIINNL